MTNYSKRFEKAGDSKVYTEYVSFLLKGLSEKIKNIDLLSQSNNSTCSVFVKTNNPNFVYCWDGIKFVNKILDMVGIIGIQDSYLNFGNGKDIIYKWTLSSKPKK